METYKINISEISNTTYNPRVIDTFKYETLKKSITDLPDMLEARPIIIDENNSIIAGNMRYRALCELGYTEVWVKKIDSFTEEQKKELMVKDNISYGEWDEQILSDNFNTSWVNSWLGNQVIDYSALLYEDVSEKMDTMYGDIKKAVHIKINGDFEKAKELEKNLKTKKIYIGGLLIDKMQQKLSEI